MLNRARSHSAKSSAPLAARPLSPGNPSGKFLLARTRTDANRVMDAVRAEIAATNPGATLSMKPTTEWLNLQNGVCAPDRPLAKRICALN